MKNPLNVFKYLPHILRKKFNEKYIIIESDDWGLERAPSADSIKWLKKKYGSEKLSRWSFDSLETDEDLSVLYEVLEKHKSGFEYPPVITANFITHNIDYSNKNELKFISLSNGFGNADKKIKILYDTGIENKFIFPQLHGFSHYNITSLEKYFLSDEGKEAFSENYFTAVSTIKGSFKFLQGELSNSNKELVKIKAGADEFRNYFGFNSATIIPPTFIFDPGVTNILKMIDLKLIQSSNRLVTSENRRIRFPYFQKRKGMYWSVRNCRLDPHEDYNFFHGQCIDSMRNAFENQIPAVIDFHRVNFAGTFAPEYRERSLRELDLLLSETKKRWPEAKFIHTQKLNEILWQQETR